MTEHRTPPEHRTEQAETRANRATEQANGLMRVYTRKTTSHHVHATRGNPRAQKSRVYTYSGVRLFGCPVHAGLRVFAPVFGRCSAFATRPLIPFLSSRKEKR